MFEGLFKAKAIPVHGEMIGTEPDGTPIYAPDPMIKFGGMEFNKLDPNAGKAFDQHIAKLKASKAMIPAGEAAEGGVQAHYPLDHPLARAEIIKADLMLNYGLTAGEAEQAVKGAKSLNLPKADVKVIYKKPPPDAGTGKEKVVMKGKAPESDLRGPRGPVPAR